MHVGITGPGAIFGSFTGSHPESGEFHDGWVSAKKDRTESADLDKVMAAQASAGSTAAPPSPRSFDPASMAFTTAPITGKQGPTKFKLTLWTQRENRTAAGQLVNTEIGGLLTLYLPGRFRLRCRTPLSSRGIYIGDKSNSPTDKRTMGTAPHPALRMAGLRGRFDPGGGNASDKFRAIFDQFASSKRLAMRLNRPEWTLNGSATTFDPASRAFSTEPTPERTSRPPSSS